MPLTSVELMAEACSGVALRPCGGSTCAHCCFALFRSQQWVLYRSVSFSSIIRQNRSSSCCVRRPDRDGSLAAPRSVA